ncbi:Kinesin light chain [Hondaea fermentalgiana]|uniref:Kinesin light chain n=1 Tax=Hondaea fermentalgiana TaxID=2315210 RepID=A0A2R5GDS0_9STRA|nr:Kinesin light chain [Hondaea fermentalgiana]|eukprot:GBG27868.1 Kinesin light chain [Hondaea fermentalgiana]
MGACSSAPSEPEGPVGPDRKSRGLGPFVDVVAPDDAALQPLFEVNVEVELPEVQVEDQGLSLAFLRDFMQEYDLERGTTWSTGKVCKDVVVEVTRERGCPMVDMVRADLRGRVTHFISHPWDNLFKLTVSAVIEACTEWEAATGETAYVWIDIFAVNQHKMQRREYTQDDIGEMLSRALQAARITLACLYPWKEPVYISRAWCLYEAHQALVRAEQSRRGSSFTADAGRSQSITSLLRRSQPREPQHELRFILSPDAREEFEREALASEFDSVLQALADIDVRRAQAYKMEDKEMILDAIESSPGGSAALNQNVALSLRRWLLQSGRTIVERRRRTHMNTAKLSQILINFGRLLGDQAQSAKEQKEAEKLFREALSIDQSILTLHRLDPEGDISEQLANVGRDEFMLGLCLYDQGRFSDCLERLESAVEVYHEYDKANEGEPVEVGRVLTRMGPVHMKLQHWGKATDTLRTAVGIFEERDPGSSEHAECLGFLAYVLSKAPERQEYPEEASDIRRRVLTFRLKLRGENHPDVAMALRELASQEQAAGNLQGAIDNLTRALAIYRKVYGDEHSKTRHVERKLVSISAALSSVHKHASRGPKMLEAQRKDSLSPTDRPALGLLPNALSTRALEVTDDNDDNDATDVGAAA